MVLNNILTLFPDQYEPTQQQTKLLSQIEKGLKTHKFVICCAPTGSGKSLIAKTLGAVAKHPSKELTRLITSYEAYKQDFSGNYTFDQECREEPPFGSFVLTITKSLQDQYLDLFDKTPLLKGKANYTCNIDENFTVDLAPCTFASKLKEKCWEECLCPYYNARNSVLLSQFGVLNYKMFLSLPSHLKRKNIIICDEASELEEELVRQFSAEVNYERLEQCGIKVKRLITDNKQRAQVWMYQLIEQIGLKIEEYLSTGYKNLQLITKNDKKQYQFLKNLHTSLTTIDTVWKECEFVIDVNKDRVQILPLHANSLSRFIFDYADKVVLMSATIIDHRHFAQQLGIHEYSYVEAQSDFDPQKSPIFVSSQHKLNYKNLKVVLPKICNQINEIINHHKNEKGIIHTHTQEITNIIQEKLGANERFLFRDQFATNEEIISLHQQSQNPSILVSPSLMFGLDLKDDLARFQIIVKLPFLPLSSKRIKKLFEKDKAWYENKMLNAVVQACGRATRGKDDHSVTYILDGNFINIVKQTKNKLPKYFIERIH